MRNLVLLLVIPFGAGCVANVRSDVAPEPKAAAPTVAASLLDLSPGDEFPDTVNAVVEIPRGSLNKYEFDRELGAMQLDRVLGGKEPYPVEYGFVPQTLMVDGDPLDFVMPTTQPTHPGVVIAARPIGVMRMLDRGEVDDKIVCVPTEDPRFRGVKAIEDLPAAQRQAMVRFFSTYKNAEGKKTSVPGFADVAEAHRLLQEAHAAYRQKAP